ncbi:MAG: enoyl-CoA hydratase/isomerase family protein [Planctomycetota bacterium]
MQHIAIKVHGHVATLMIDRPDRSNALDSQLLADLRQGLSDLHQEKKVRAMILTSSGDHFCAGVDLELFQNIACLPQHEQPPRWFDYWRQLAELCEELLRFPKPIVAAVDGAAIGAGFAIGLACDLIVASRRATFAVPAVHRGLVGGITAALLAFRSSTSLASQLALTGLVRDANEIYQTGILCEPPVAPDQIWVTANQWAGRCAVGAPPAIAATKRMINETIGEALLSQLASASADAASLCHHDTAIEGVAAFMEKRDPDWDRFPTAEA